MIITLIFRGNIKHMMIVFISHTKILEILIIQLITPIIK